MRVVCVLLRRLPGPNYLLPEVVYRHILIKPLNSRRQLTLAKQTDIINEENSGLKNANGSELNEVKKAFVEPAISVPVDVLEATTFFQAATSGATN